MNLQETFGSLVFNDAVMRQRLPKETYKALHRTIAEGKSLNLEVASVVANTMKDWAVEKGATHYTHWFQPMTGITAGRPAGDLRSPGLHCLGPHQLRLYQGWHPVHPHGLLQLRRPRAGQENAAAPLQRGGQPPGQARAAAVGPYRREKSHGDGGL